MIIDVKGTRLSVKDGAVTLKGNIQVDGRLTVKGNFTTSGGTVNLN